MFRKDKERSSNVKENRSCSGKTSGLLLWIFYSSDLHERIKKNHPQVLFHIYQKEILSSLTLKLKNYFNIIPFLLLTKTDVFSWLSCYEKSEFIQTSSNNEFLFLDVSSCLHLYMTSVYSGVFTMFFSMLSKIMMTAQLQLRATKPPEDNTHVQE